MLTKQQIDRMKGAYKLIKTTMPFLGLQVSVVKLIESIPVLLAHIEAAEAENERIHKGNVIMSNDYHRLHKENARLREALRGAEHLGIVARDFPCQSKDEPPRGWYMCYCGTRFVYVDGVLQGKHGDRCPFKALEREGE